MRKSETRFVQSLAGITLIAIVGVAPAAAQLQSASVPGIATHAFGPASSQGASGTALTGDTVNVAVTAFSTAGGALLTGPAVHLVGTTSTIPTAAIGLIPNHRIITAVTTIGSTRTLSMQIDALGVALAPSGLLVGGVTPTSLFFEVPDFNGGPDLFNDPDKISPASGSFDLLGTGFAVLFSTAAGVVDTGTSFSIGNGVSIPSGDIFSAASVGDIITGGRWSISYQVIPTPATICLLGFGGLLHSRRRR